MYPVISVCNSFVSGINFKSNTAEIVWIWLTNVFTILHQMKLSLEPSLEKLPGLYLVLFQQYACMCPALHTVDMIVFCIT